jgi:hypothetical protein
LLADIFLWQERYAEANALCDEVIGSNRFSLIPVEKFEVEVGEGGIIVDTVTVANESDADKMFVQTYVNGRSVESIFEITIYYRFYKSVLLFYGSNDQSHSSQN